MYKAPFAIHLPEMCIHEIWAEKIPLDWCHDAVDRVYWDKTLGENGRWIKVKAIDSFDIFWRGRGRRVMMW